VPEHVIDDEGADPDVRAWFDEMRDRHNAEEKAEEESVPLFVELG
jgi:hypothetical protein